MNHICSLTRATGGKTPTLKTLDRADACVRPVASAVPSAVQLHNKATILLLLFFLLQGQQSRK